MEADTLKCADCPYREGWRTCNFADTLFKDVYALLKEQEAKERKWLQTIADNQIANATKDSPMSLDEQLESEYKSGIYDGLQMAFEILTEDW